MIASAPNVPSARADFLARLVQVREEMTTAEVERLLGKPDKVERSVPKLDSREFQVWQYGLSPGGKATLGTIRFVQGWAYQIEGGAYVTPGTELLSEALLRDSIELVQGPDYVDTRSYVRALNRLIELGSEKATVVMREVKRLQSLEFGSITIPNILAVPPRDWKEIIATGEFRRFSTFFADDIPFRTSPAYVSFGGPRKPVQMPAPLGVIRTRKIVPPENPFRVLRDLFAEISKSDRTENTASPRMILSVQLLSLVETAYRPAGYPGKSIKFTAEEVERWEREWLELGGHWDRRREIYVRKDGSTLLEERQNAQNPEPRIR